MTSPAPTLASPVVRSSPPPRWRLPLTLLLVVAVAALGAWLATSGVGQTWKTPAAAAKLPAPAEAPPMSLLVLPPRIAGSGHEALADGLHRDLVAEAARLRGFYVIARDTAAGFGAEADPRQAAREGGVRHVLRSSARIEGGTTLVLDVELLDGDDATARWKSSQRAGTAEQPQLVAEVGSALQRALQAEMTRVGVEKRVDRLPAPPPRAPLSPTQLAADTLAMRGWWHHGQGPAHDAEAQALLDQAVAQDPDSVRGWSGLASLHGRALIDGRTGDRGAALARLDEAVRRLRQLDADGAAAARARTLQLWAMQDYAALLQHTTAQLERHADPLTPSAHGTALMLGGRVDDAVMFFLWALRASPKDPQRADWANRIAFAHFAAGRYALARDWAQAANADAGAATSWPPVHAAALWRLGEADAARAAYAAHVARHPGTGRAQLARLLGADAPRLVDGRERLLASLRELGMTQ